MTKQTKKFQLNITYKQVRAFVCANIAVGGSFMLIMAMTRNIALLGGAFVLGYLLLDGLYTAIFAKKDQ